MPQTLHFILLTLIIAAGVFSGTTIVRIPGISPGWWVVPVLLFSLGLSGLLRRFSINSLFLALPLAAMTAYMAGGMVWPRPHASTPVSDMSSEPLVPLSVNGLTAGKGRTLLGRSGTDMSVFAEGLANPRMLAFDDHGVLFASLPGRGQVVALPDENGDGRADRLIVFAEGLDRPHGLAFYNGSLFVAETGRILRLDVSGQNLKVDHQAVISTDLPSGGGHWTRSLVVDEQGGIYVSIGSDCNACLEDDPRRGTVLRMAASGGRGKIFAYGLRNSVGLAIDPAHHHIWASDNGRDLLGDDLPPDEINLLVEGGDYGWPFCYGQRVPDPELGSDLRCRDTIPSEVDLQAHSAPLGLTFGHGLQANEEIRSSLLVAYHGSWNRSVPTGYKLVTIPFHNGRPAGPPRDLIVGWLTGGRAWGRPVAPVVGPDGALYLSDDRAGVIYRILFPTDKS